MINYILDKIKSHISNYKKPKYWLFTDWSWGMSEFKIYTSYSDMKIITYRKIKSGNITNWFNIDNVKGEIIEYSKLNNINIKGLNETLDCIDSYGFSYNDKNIETYIKKSNEINKDYIKSDKKHRINIIE